MRILDDMEIERSHTATVWTSFILMAAALIVFGSLSAAAAATSGSNLLENASFESEPSDALPTGWEALNPESEPGINVLIEEGQAYDGNRALVLYNTSASTSVGVRSTPVPAQIGTTYRASVMAQSDGSAPALIFIEFLDEEHNRVEASNTRQEGTDWQSLTLELTAPEGAVYVSVLLYSGRRATGVVQFDNPALAIVSSAEGM